ncbi:MAG TPA: ATP-binding cassette domain-containing protein [Vicinamibacterales bacterium]|nr:ATP-binding cassette domain-containing protein [Vicinamibacterales bacterium]
MLSVRDLAVQYGRRLVFQNVSFNVRAGESLGVIGPNGAGKTTLLRALVGLLAPRFGEVRINGLMPRDAARRTGIAYFAGDATLPGSVRAVDWGSLGNGDVVTVDRRPLRALSRGSRQMIGLRTALGITPLGLVVLDEPWEGLDADAARWLTTMIETKRDRGAAVVLSSHRLYDLAGLCDAYLFLLAHQVTLMKAHEIAPVGPVTAALLTEVFDRLRGGPHSLRAVS